MTFKQQIEQKWRYLDDPFVRLVSNIILDAIDKCEKTRCKAEGLEKTLCCSFTYDFYMGLILEDLNAEQAAIILKELLTDAGFIGQDKTKEGEKPT